MLIKLGLFDELGFCGVKFGRKSLCDITEWYYKLSDVTKKELKLFGQKVFDNDEIEFDDLIHHHSLIKIMDVFNIQPDEEFSEQEIIMHELEYLGFRLTENKERWNEISNAVEEIGISHISDFDDD